MEELENQIEEEVKTRSGQLSGQLSSAMEQLEQEKARCADLEAQLEENQKLNQ